MTKHNHSFKHPYDTIPSAAFRFAAEVIAWVSGPWAASLIATWLIVPALLILIGLPSIFSTKGDKRTIVVNTPGPIRILIELMQYAVAAIAPWFVWSPVAAITSGVIVFLALATGFPRMVWLSKGGGKPNGQPNTNPPDNLKKQ